MGKLFSFHVFDLPKERPVLFFPTNSKLSPFYQIYRLQVDFSFVSFLLWESRLLLPMRNFFLPASISNDKLTFQIPPNILLKVILNKVCFSLFCSWFTFHGQVMAQRNWREQGIFDQLDLFFSLSDLFFLLFTPSLMIKGYPHDPNMQQGQFPPQGIYFS